MAGGDLTATMRQAPAYPTHTTKHVATFHKGVPWRTEPQFAQKNMLRQEQDSRLQATPLRSE